ncbi:MAG: hypothetical protein WCO65_01330 [bacterium]
MKKLILLPFLVSFYVSFSQKKSTISGFKNSDRYDQENAIKVDTSLFGIPILEGFKYTSSMEFLHIDLVADKKFIAEDLPKYVDDFYKKYKFPSEGKKHFVKIHLKSGGWIIFPENRKKDSRIFIAVSPYYYFVIRGGQIIYLYYNKDKMGNILGRNDGFWIENFPIDVIKELIYNRKIISNKESKK